MAHTPGPWTVSGNEINVKDKDGDFVATTLKYDEAVGTQQDYDNAKLIAAAPDLLAALESMIQLVEQDYSGFDAIDQWQKAVGAVNKAKNL